MKNRESVNTTGSIEEWLRRRLEPEREVIERTIARSLATTSDRSKRYRVSWRRCGAVVAILLVVTVVAVALFDDMRLEKTRGTETSRDITITNASGNVEVFYTSRGSVDPSTIPSRTVRREGGLTVFNHGRVVAAIQTNENPRYFILGGGS